MKKFFLINEDFEKIITDAIKASINKIEVISTGWTNIVYRVEADNGNYYLRFPRDEFWEKTIIKDYEFAKYIKGKTSFETVDLRLGHNEGRAFSIHKEIPGVCLADKVNEMSEKDVQKVSSQISKFMYELHNIKFDENEIFTINNIGLELNDFIDELLNKHVYEEDRKFWSINNFKIASFEPKCLVHGDLNSSNIIVDENNNVKAIIDFGFGGFGNKYFDIARILSRETPNNFSQSIIKNYEKISGEKLDEQTLNTEIKIWKDIDSGYINYMRGIGIYK